MRQKTLEGVATVQRFPQDTQVSLPVKRKGRARRWRRLRPGPKSQKEPASARQK